MKPSTSFIFFSGVLLLLPLAAALVTGDIDCDAGGDVVAASGDRARSLKLKLIAVASILTAAAAGVLIPMLGRTVPALRPDGDAFLVVKAFAAGVILATAMIHILPDAFDRLNSPCLSGPWRRFPFAGLVAMAAALAMMMVDTAATSYYRRACYSKARPVEAEEEDAAAGDHFHSHGAAAPPVHGGDAGETERIRNRVVSQVLELGIVVHSVIIGVTLGASQRSTTIRPLVGALSFHQFFEGIGLGGCIIQANFRPKATVIMAVFFSLTTPVGIGLGIGVSSIYDESSTTALVVEGIFNAASAGILIYMALVDLLAADFMSARLQANGWLQLGAHIALLLGSGFMSLLAIWA